MTREPGLIFLSGLDERAASHRFRVLKLLPGLREAGIDVELIRTPGWKAALGLLQHRLVNPRRSVVVVFQKTRHPRLAQLARGLGATLVMDLDDGGNQAIDGSVAPPSLLAEIESWVRSMDLCVASVDALKDWLAPWSDRIELVPTCLDTEAYAGLRPRGEARCVIGWVGGQMGSVVLPPLEPALAEVCDAFDAEFVAVGQNAPSLGPRVPMRNVPWTLDCEPAIFGELDVGIMPLPDNARARMKAGFKLLQYMAAGLPVVASPIGVNREIVRNGENGFLADGVDEWREALATLAGDPEGRRRMGENGRRLVEDNFSTRVAVKRWVEIFASLS